MENNLTTLVSTFVRAYHQNDNNLKVYKDEYANLIITSNEYNQIENELVKGINFFNPNFHGTKEESLKWIINNILGPSVIGRQAFLIDSLKKSIELGCKEYLSFASGYDTSTYADYLKTIKVFEIDKPTIIDDKIKRVERSKINNNHITYLKCDFSTNNYLDTIINSTYNSNSISFSSLMGISYYLTKEEFTNLIKNISSITCGGSSIMFDYPTIKSSNNFQEQLASSANEEMKSKYTYQEIEKILEDNNFLVYEHLDYTKMNNNYYYNYNTLNPDNLLLAKDDVEYILAVKKHF